MADARPGRPVLATALGAGGPRRLVPIDGIGLAFDVDGSPPPGLLVAAWNSTGYTERWTTGPDVLGDAYRDLAPCREVACFGRVRARDLSSFTRRAATCRLFDAFRELAPDRPVVCSRGPYPDVEWVPPVRVGA